MVVIFCPTAATAGTEQERTGDAVQMHGAGAALGHAATELGADQFQFVTQHPQQWLVVRDLDVVIGAVDVQFYFGHGARPSLLTLN